MFTTRSRWIAALSVALAVSACDEDTSTELDADAGPVGKADGHECEEGEECSELAYEFERGETIGDSGSLSEVHLVADPDSGSTYAFAFPYVDGDYRATVWALGDDGEWVTVEQTLDDGPSQRLHYATTWDAERSRMVLFGGQVPGPGLGTFGAAVFDEVWEWAPGEGWTHAPAAGSWPVGRAFHEIAFDERLGEVVLFGGAGIDWDDRDLDDLWSWDGNAWTLLDDGGGPSARRGAAMAYDPDEERTLVYGGGPGSGFDRTSDLWAWDEDGWTEIAGDGPDAARWPTMIYDPQLDAPIAFHERELWMWRDDVWEELEVKGIRDGGFGPRTTEAVVHPVTNTAVVLERRYAWSARPAVGNLAPRIDIPDRVVATPTHTLRRSIHIFDPEGDDLDIEFEGLPEGAYYNRYVDEIIWPTPPLEMAGEYPVTITASDGEQTTTRRVVLVLEARTYDFLPSGPVDQLVTLSSMRITRSLGGTTRGGSATGSCRFSGINPGIVNVSCGISTPALRRWGSSVLDRQVGFGGETPLAEHGSFSIDDGYESTLGVPVFSATIQGSISDGGELRVGFRWRGYIPSTTSNSTESGIAQLPPPA